jgi:hypothetical protein
MNMLRHYFLPNEAAKMSIPLTSPNSATLSGMKLVVILYLDLRANRVDGLLSRSTRVIISVSPAAQRQTHFTELSLAK